MQTKNKYLPYLMWLFPLAFFTYQFILRLWPGLMMQNIMQQFTIDATSFGVLASCYYYGYAGMQIPIAMLLDRYGARYVVFICAVICGLATFMFINTNNWYLALFSRFLVGVGSAVGFLGTSKIISQWFPKEDYTKMIGFSFTIGLMGAIYGGKPVSILVSNLGWYQVAFTLTLVSLAIGIFTYLVVREPKHTQHIQDPFRLSDFKKLLSSPAIWILAIANLLMVGSLEGFADVWGVNYLMIAHAITKADAAAIISYVFIGMLFGGPLLAVFSKHFGNFKVISFCGFGMAAIFTYLVMFDLAFNWYVFAGLFFLVGIMCCYQVLVFAAGADFVSVQLLGVTVAFLNCINMLGGSFFHTLIGFMMDTFWTGELSNGIRQYSESTYNSALLVIPLCAIVGACMVLFIGLRLKKAK